MALTVRIDGVPIVRAALAAAPKAFAQTLRQGFRDIGQTFVNEFATAHLRGQTGPERVAVRTGGLRRAFGYRMSGTTLPDLAVHFGFGPPAVQNVSTGVLGQARAHLFGAHIVPRRAKWLWIPLKANRTRAGVARLQPSDLPAPIFISRTHHGPDTRAQGRARRSDVRDLVRNSARPVAFPRRAGPGWVILWREKALFVLVPEVDIPARLPLERDWKRFEPRARKRLDTAAHAAILQIEKATGSRGATPLPPAAGPTGGGGAGESDS